MRISERARRFNRSTKSRGLIAASFSLESMEARWLMSTTIAQWTFTTKETASSAYISPSSGTPGVTFVNGQSTGTPTVTAIGMTQSGTTDNEDIVASTPGVANPPFSEVLWRIRGGGSGSNGNTNGWSLQAPQYSQGIEIDLNTTGYSNLNTLNFDWYDTTTGVKDMMVQYNLDTTTSAGWTNLISSPLAGSPNDYYGGADSSPTNSIDLSGISGSANDPHFGIRLVSAYDPNFSPGAYSQATSATSGTQTQILNTKGNWEFNNISVTGTLGAALKPTITQNPLSETVAAGSQVTLTAAGNGNPTPTVQWEISTNDGSSFSSISGANSTSYTFTATEGMSGDEFEAVFTNASGSATTTPATIIVAGTPISQWFFTSGLAPTAQSTAPGTGNAPLPSLAGSPTDSAGTLGLENDYAGTQSFPEADILPIRSTVNPSFNEYIWRVRGGSGLGPTGSPGTPDGWSQFAPEYTQGVVFDVNTTGYSNITLQFDWNQGGIADMQPQYSPDGGNTWINIGNIIQASGNDYYGITSTTNPTGATVNLSGIAAANNNPNFQLRLVSAYDPNLPMITDGNELDPTVHGQYASAGFGPANAEQAITLGSTNNFQLTFNDQTTSAITYDGTPGDNFTFTNMATNIANALAALTNIGAGNISVVAADQTGLRYLVTFKGTLADAPQPTMTSSDPAATVQTWVNGTNSPTGVTRYVDGSGSWQLGNINFNGDKISGAPGITLQPASISVTGGTVATFTAAAYSELNPLSVQWEVSTNNGQSYSPINGANELNGSTSTYSFTTNINLSESSNLYEAIFTNPGGSTATQPAKLTVVAPVAPFITQQPYSISVQAGNVAIFSAAANGAPTPTVQWQINSGSGWSNLSDSTTVSGSTSDTLHFTTNADGSENGDQFRAVYTNLVSSTPTNAVTMTVLGAETVLTDWDFGKYADGTFTNSPAPTGGVVDSGTASMVGMTLPYNGSDPATGSSGSVDAGDITNTPGALNPGFNEETWRVRGGVDAEDGGTPANGWSNFAPEYTQGAQFSVPTTGFKDIYVTMDWYSTTSGILDAQEQYTLDGTNWINIGPQIQAVSNDFYDATATGAPVPLVIDVSGISGASNNPNFGIRLVSAYNPTLPLIQNPNDPGNPDDKVGQYANAALTGSPPTASPYNGSKGNWRFDNIVFHGDALTPVSVLSGQVATTPSQSLSLQFSSDVSASLSTGSLKVAPLFGGAPATVNSLSFNGNNAIFGFSPNLVSGIYKATLSANGIHDANGSYLTSDYTFDFLLLNNGDTLALPSGSQTFTLQQILIGSGATLDIGNNVLIDQYSITGEQPAAGLGASIDSGFNNGAWNGTGIISSAAAADATHASGVGLFDSGTQLTIARTWYGDSNLDGKINADDISLMMLGQSQAGTRWQDGDFSYHNRVDADDWMKLLLGVAVSSGQSLGVTFNSSASIQTSQQTAVANISLATASVPLFAQTPIDQNDDLLDSSDSIL